MLNLNVNASVPYNIHIGKGMLKSIGKIASECVKGAGKAVIVADDNVAPLYAKTVKDALVSAGFSTAVKVIKSGETHKTPNTYLDVISAFSEFSLTRSDLAIALGGGVTGDITGFAAATYMRGISFIQVPTTLLSATDSSVGGKTGVNLPEGKNLLGAFHQPASVVFDTDVIKTLPKKFFRDGVGEGIKYAVMRGGRVFEILDSGLSDDNLGEYVLLCCKIKKEIVEADERECGVRKLLNLGHTTGHALEKLSDFAVSHGEAVAAGVLYAAQISKKLGYMTDKDTMSIRELINKYELRKEIGFTPEALSAEITRDKKANCGSVDFILPYGIGDVRVINVSLNNLAEFLTI